jgi:SNF2 family DNA or RNA helicase
LNNAFLHPYFNFLCPLNQFASENIPASGFQLKNYCVIMDSERRLKFIVALSDHRYLGVVFAPYLVEPLKSYYSIRTSVRIAGIDDYDYDFNDDEREIVRLTSKYSDVKLSTKFSRSQNSTEFFNNLTAEYLKSHIIPYVSKQMYVVALLLMRNNIPVFEKEAKYANLYDEDIIKVPEYFASSRFAFNRNNDGTRYQVKLYLNNEYIPLINRKVKIVTYNPCVMLVRDRLLVFSDMDAKKVLPFMEREAILVPKNIEPKYFSNFVLNMVRDYQVEANGFNVFDEEIERKSILSLEKNIRNHPVLVLRFVYGNKEILLNDSRDALVNMHFENDDYTFFRYTRDKDWETEIVGFLIGIGLKEEAGGYTLPNVGLMEEESALYALVTWLSAYSQSIAEMNISIRQSFFSKSYFTGSQHLSFDLKRNKDWFDLYAIVQIGEYKFPFIKLRKYILNDIREFELPNGEIAILPEEWFEQYRQLIQLGKVDGDKLVFGKYFYNLLRHRVPGHIPSVLQQLEKSLASANKIPLPENLNATLRSYQISGYQWMYSLVKNGMGGCLADDMGLGKTLQTLALLLKFQKQRSFLTSFSSVKEGQLSLFDIQPIGEEEVQPASLIIVPTSLVHNWINEIRKFAPSLNVFIHTGAQRNRNGSLKNIVNEYDTIITTYGTLRNDKAIFEKTEFFITILDESQYIKNKSSKIFEAVMSLKSKHRLVLTGTPIENSLSDLWSQMNFLNKGLLGNYNFFKQNYQTPIENRSEEKVEEKLQLLIRPFILRRTKSEVASDLPPLMESVMYCTMSPDQEKAYEREKSLIRNTILANIEAKGVANSAIVILQGLIKLRQLANHSPMEKDEEDIESGKFSEIFLALSNLVSENHKVLIFSSFVKHLNLLRQRIEQQGWKYSLLTGKTLNREEVINDFQNDSENKIFLISLKAGGVGLNLTGADYVFIVDPWWNPAAENQAISRAHRIGQDKKVFVYRFITENSIEEKIQLLKERKSALAHKFINSNNPFKAITREEIAVLFE